MALKREDSSITHLCQIGKIEEENTKIPMFEKEPNIKESIEYPELSSKDSMSGLFAFKDVSSHVSEIVENPSYSASSIPQFQKKTIVIKNKKNNESSRNLVHKDSLSNLCLFYEE